jgi:hypothetical protein
VGLSKILGEICQKTKRFYIFNYVADKIFAIGDGKGCFRKGVICSKSDKMLKGGLWRTGCQRQACGGGG